jgi:hypothetical protein
VTPWVTRLTRRTVSDGLAPGVATASGMKALLKDAADDAGIAATGARR